jgi:hypothetical protein
MNYFNKIKISLQNAHGSPQYFFLFWTGLGNIDLNRLKNSFSQVLFTYDKFFESYAELLKKPFYNELPFLSIQYKQPLLKTIENFLEKNSVEIIEQYGYSPIILIFFYHPENNEFCILQMNNHIHLDGISGYLFFRDLVATYNLNCDENYKYSISHTTDAKLIETHLAEFSLIKRIGYRLQRQKIPLKKKFSNKKLEIRKIYNYKNDNTREVNYTFIHIPSIKKTGNRNNLILSEIAKHLMESKGHLINNTLVLGIPINVRKNKEFIGNHAAPYHILIKNYHLNNIYSHIEKKMKQVRSFSKRLAMYALTAEAVSNATVEDTFKVFHSFSNKMHCYVTNIQDYFYINHAKFFTGTTIGLTGLFGYPLQANIATLFSVTYCKDSVGISLACSPMIMTKAESQSLLEGIKLSLVA